MLSIIVPVYNAESFIGRCIESVLNQSYKDFELILVNDGSLDSSLDVCKKYAEKDKRIVVINKKHCGVSKCRNAGLDAAKGDYITFVDSDDYVGKERYTKTIKAMKEHKAEIVQCSWYNVEGDSITLKTPTDQEGLYIMPKRLIGRWCVWNKVFDKKFFKKHKIRFYDFGYQGEDTAVSTLCYVKAKRVYCIEEPLHYRVVRENSLQHSIDKSGKENLLRVYKKLYSDLIKQNAYKLFIGLTKRMIEQTYRELK